MTAWMIGRTAAQLEVFAGCYGLPEALENQ